MRMQRTSISCTLILCPVEQLHFHDHGKDHGTAMRLLIEKFAQRVLDLVFDKRPVRSMTVKTNKRCENMLTSSFEQFLGVTHIDKAARDDVWASYRLTCLFIDGEHSHE